MKIKITQTQNTADFNQQLIERLANEKFVITSVDLEKEATHLLQAVENQSVFIFLITNENLKKLNRNQWNLLKRKHQNGELKVLLILVEETAWFYTPYATDFPIFPADKIPVSVENLDELVIEINSYLNNQNGNIEVTKTTDEDSETVLAKAEREELKWQKSSTIIEESDRKNEEIPRLQTEAATLETARKWTKAIEKYREAINLTNDENILKLLSERLKNCESQLDITSLITKGKQAYKYDNFDTALDCFRQVYAINGDEKVEEAIKKIESKKRNKKIEKKAKKESQTKLFIILGVIAFIISTFIFIQILNKEKPITVNEEEIPPYEMVFVNGGTFTMGKRGVEGSELEHEVILNSFYIGQHEITVEMYDLYCQEMSLPYVNLSTSQRGKLAMTKVSWFNTVHFANWLSLREGYNATYIILGDEVMIDENADGYRLPSESQWEFAAQGGLKSKNYRYSGGEVSTDVSWNSSNAKGGVHAIKQKKPNELGLYDMSGNVWEWCWDWHDEAAYENHETTEPEGGVYGNYRVIRGGSWFSKNLYLRTKSRSMELPNTRDVDLGFRLVRPFDGTQN
jgi:formylglycine-generating enzyme required for sulfatase activity